MFGLFGSSSIKTVTPQEAHELASSGKALLVDVREPGEWASGHVPGAFHAPLSRFAEAAPAIPTDKPVIFYCAMGGRSAQAVQFAKRLGLPHDTHMGGGIGAWRMHGLPVGH